jgi:hypothetical protein
MYFPRNWEFSSALSKLRNFGGFQPPNPPPPRYATVYHHPVPLSRNLGTLTSWNPLGQSRPVTGLLYLLPLRWGMTILLRIFASTLFARRLATSCCSRGIYGGPWAACEPSEFFFCRWPPELFKTVVEYGSKTILYK